MGLSDPGVWSQEFIKLFDLSSGEKVRTFVGHTSGVNAVAALPDGNCIISGSSDCTIRLWNCDLSIPTSRTAPQEKSWFCPIISMPDGKTTVHAVRYGPLNVLKAIQAREKEGRIIGQHRDFITAIAVVPDGSIILSSSIDGTLRVWDFVSAKEQNCLQGGQWITNALAAMPNGKQGILYNSEKQALRIFDIESGAEANIISVAGHEVRALVVLPDGSEMITASRDCTLRLWDIRTGRELKRYEGHTGEVSAVALLCDGQHFVSASIDKTLRLWNLTGQEALARFDGDAPFNALVSDAAGSLAWARDDLDRMHLFEFLTSSHLEQYSSVTI